MKEAIMIMNNAAKIPLYHGSTIVNVVDEIMDSCGGQILCNGQLREFVFTRITDKSFKFKTENYNENISIMH